MTSHNKSDLRAEYMMRDIQSLHAKVDQALQSTIRQNVKMNREKENRIRYCSSLSPSRLVKTPSAQTHNPSSQNIPQLKSLYLNIPPKKESMSSREQDLRSPKTSSTSRPKKEDLNLSKFVFFNPFHSPTNAMPMSKKEGIMSNISARAPQTTRERGRNLNLEEIFKRTPQRQQPEPPQTCRGNIEEQRIKSPLTEVRANIQNQIFVPKYNKEQLDQIISNIRKRNNTLTQHQQQLERSPPLHPVIPLQELNKNIPLRIAPLKTENRAFNSCRTSYHHPQPQTLKQTSQKREPERLNNETKQIPIKIKNEVFGGLKSQSQPKTPKPFPREETEPPNKERLESSTLNYQIGSEDWKMYPKYTFTSGDEDVQKILQFFDKPEIDKRPYPKESSPLRVVDYYCGTLENDTNESLRPLPEKATLNPDLTDLLRRRNHKRARSECMNIRSIPIKKVPPFV